MTDAAQIWAGYAEVQGAVEFVKLNGPIVPGGVSIDMPNLRAYGLAMTLEAAPGGEVCGRVTAAGVTVRLCGRSDGRAFAGRSTAGGVEGAFMLRRLAVWDVQGWRKLSAQYEIAGGRRISVHVNADDWAGEPMLFYCEDDRIVRLYPDVSGSLISEAAEAFKLTAGRGGICAVQILGPGEQSPQVPVARLPGWAEEEVTVCGPAGVLAGTLMKPPGAGPYPAIVLVHGAAGGLRDVYRAFGEHFVQAGMAALVYDKRGHGGSAGGAGPTFAEKSLDAEAWVDYLQARPDIRPDRVGVWGFSNGSWVAPLVAARRPDVAFLAVIGAAGTTVIETEIHRRVFDLREQGVPEEQIEQVAELWRLVYALLVARQPGPQHADRFDRLSAAVRGSGELASITIQDYVVEEPFLGPLPPWRSYQEIVDDLPNYPAEPDEWTCDPADSYQAITVPVLFLAGDSDSNLPGLHGARRAAKALSHAGNHHATVLVFPNTGHLMNLVDPGTGAGMTSEEAGYRFHHFRFAGGFRDIVRSWAATQASA